MSDFIRLIHNQASRRHRILVPSVRLAAAAIVAAVLLLASMVTTEAEAPEIEPEQSEECAGIGSGLVVVDEEQSVSQAVSTPDNSCRFSITVTPPSQNTGEIDCQVTYTPEAFGQSGMRITVEATGDCEGVRMASRVEIEAPEATVPTPSGANVGVFSGFIPESKQRSRKLTQIGSRQGFAKIVGNEVIHAPMFIHYSKAYWTYTSNLILSARQEAPTPWGNANWHYHDEDSGNQMHAGSNSYEAWQEVDWHSDGYPFKINRDVYAWSKATFWAGLGGSYSCNFEMVWGSGKGWYPKLHHEEQCWAS